MPRPTAYAQPVSPGPERTPDGADRMTEDPILGPGWISERIDLGADEEGPLHATLVHRRAAEGAPDRAPILVMHGWSDYVFDRELLNTLVSDGHPAWALDLRKYGRSLRPGQTPTAIHDLREYDAEIDAALDRIGRDTPPIILAHSTGGLTASLYAQRYPGAVRGLALNSPWLEMHLGSAVRRLLTGPVCRLAARRGARLLLPQGSTHYARTTHREHGGRFEYDLELKPPGGHPFPACTLAAVLRAQDQLRRGPALDIPILVLCSTRSRIGPVFTESMRRADAVLDVHSLRRAARRLGEDVQISAIDGARHDVFLSDADARAAAMRTLRTWLTELGEHPSTMEP